jgi:hypothetical protein
MTRFDVWAVPARWRAFKDWSWLDVDAGTRPGFSGEQQVVADIAATIPAACEPRGPCRKAI